MRKITGGVFQSLDGVMQAPGAPPGAVKLISSDASSTGVIIATYEPAGAVPLGTFELPSSSAAELKRRDRLAREG